MGLSDIGERLGDFTKLTNRDANGSTIAFSVPTLLKGIIDKIELKLEVALSSNQLKCVALVGIEFFS